jgi:uncharacterized protein with HEPN domain
MKRNIRLYLQDLWESILAIEKYTKNLSEEEFISNNMIQDAVVRRLEIMGEAVKNIDDEYRNKYPLIPWKKIAGMRDIITHEYFGVKLDRIWDVIRKDLPGLREKIKIIIDTDDLK